MQVTVWAVEHPCYGRSNGVYSRKTDAVKRMRKNNIGRDLGWQAIEYKLVPTGATVSFMEGKE